jgi:hypothetical protein
VYGDPLRSARKERRKEGEEGNFHLFVFHFDLKWNMYRSFLFLGLHLRV